MKNLANDIRKCVINELKGEPIDSRYEKVVGRFIYYMDAYCAELKCTECDILLNDERYESVFSLFNNIILKKEFSISEFEIDLLVI